MKHGWQKNTQIQPVQPLRALWPREGSYSRLASADFSFRAGLSSDSMVLAQGMGSSILAPDLNSGCSEQLLLRQHLDSL